MIKVGIVGGTGYTGIELLRILARHPQSELVAITSRKDAGIPVAEVFPSLRGAVAIAGCYPTAVQLGLLPLAESRAVDLDHLIADAKSGVSGAGKKTEEHLLFSEASDNFKTYSVSGHRHWPEIRQELDAVAGRSVGLTFVPHLTPMIRGIHATLYARITADVEFQKLYEDRYRDEPFVDVLPGGSEPDTTSVRATNTCRIAIHRPNGGDMLVVLSVIDNPVKGDSGQAVQHMNIMFGFEETMGLSHLAIVP